MKLFTLTLLGLGYFANAQDYEQEQDYEPGPRSDFVGISGKGWYYYFFNSKLHVKTQEKMNVVNTTTMTWKFVAAWNWVTKWTINQNLTFTARQTRIRSILLLLAEVSALFNDRYNSISTLVKCGGNGKGRNKNTPRKVYCVKSESYGAVKMIWGNPKAKAYDVKAFGCDAPSKYGSQGKDKSKDKYNGGKDKNKYNGDKDKDKYPTKKPQTPKPYKPTTKPYQKPTQKPYKPTQKPTYKPTTKNPYKPTTKKPYNPPKPTKKPYQPPKNNYNNNNKY